MHSSRLEINGVNVPLTTEIPVATTYSISDIREPDKRQSTNSKTIKVKGSGEVNQLFGFIFEINSYGEDPSFNPNKKTSATYYINDVPVLFGAVQLLEITIDNSGVEYDLFFVANTGNFFPGLANKKLTDIDMSDLDHTFDHTSDKYNPTLGVGYCYPFIDYGITGFPLANTWTFIHLKPAIFEREYLTRIFAAEGKTWTSAYLDSNEYKRIIIPDSRDGILRTTDAPTSDLSFEANIAAPVDGTTHNAVHLGSGVWRLRNQYEDYVNPVPLNVEVSDPSGSYNNATYIWTCPASGRYNFTTWLEYNIVVNTSNAADTCSGSIKLEVSLYKSDDGGSTWYLLNAKYPVVVFNSVSPATTQFTSLNAQADPAFTGFFAANQKVKYVIRMSNFRDVALLNSGSPVTTGIVSSFVKMQVGTEIKGIADLINLQYGETVPMNRVIPENVTQLDFIKGIIICDNLYIEQDPEDPNNFIIEPRDDFYAGAEVLDWTNKADYSKPISIKPMGELDAKKYLLTYRTDTDQYNVDYTRATNEIYGQYLKEIDNDFITSVKRLEPVFSASPGVGSDINDIVAPRFWVKKSDFEVQPTKVNIRRLIWGSTKASSPFNFDVNGTVYSSVTYPFCGMVDDPYAPTYDIGFGLPEYIYWRFTGQYTLNNRYNLRYSRMFGEITDRNSKIVSIYIVLNETDLYNFSFSKIIFIKDAYYLINRIIDFDPQKKESVEVELLKLTNYTPDSTGGIDLIDNDNDIEMAVPAYVSSGIGSAELQNEVIFIGSDNVVGTGFDFENETTF